MTFNLCGLAPLIRCHELLTLSASFTESTVSTRWRLGTPGAQRQREDPGRCGAARGPALTQEFVDVVLLQVADEVPLDLWTRA